MKLTLITLALAITTISPFACCAQADSLSPKWMTWRDGVCSIGIAQGGMQLVQGELYTLPYYFAKGSMALSVWKLPLRAQFYISDLAWKGGRRNSFNVEFDVQQYKRQQLEKLRLDRQLALLDVDSLQLVKQDYLKHLMYWENVGSRDHLKELYPLDTNLVMPNLQDSIPVPLDSLSQPVLSRMEEIKTWRSRIEAVEQEINRLNELKRRRDQLAQMELSPEGLWNGKLKLSQINSFKLGAQTPSVSDFLLNNTRLVGIYAAGNGSKFYGEVAAGWIRPQMDLSLGDPSSFMDRTREMLENKDGRLALVRLGYGLPSATHIWIAGFMGHSNQTGWLSANSERHSRNVELEGQYVKGSFSARVKAAKNFFHSGSSAEVLPSSDPMNGRSNLASETKLDYKWSKIKTDLQGKLNWIGPEYYTAGNPFLRSDNATYNAKIRNQSWKYAQPAVLYSYSVNNVLKTRDTESAVSYLGYDLVSRPWNRLIIHIMYAPARVTTKQEGRTTTSMTQLYTGDISYNYVNKSIQWTNQIGFNKNIQVWDIGLFESQVWSAVSQLSHIKGSGLSVQLQSMDIKADTLNTSWKQCAVKAQTKLWEKVSVEAGAQLLDVRGADMGWNVGISCPLHKSLSCAMMFERYPSMPNNGFLSPNNWRPQYMAQAQLNFMLQKR